MDDFADIAARLEARLAELTARANTIEDDLRQPLDADFSEQAVDLADDEALEGVDDVLRAEAAQVRAALTRIANGTYGTCAKCGEAIPRARLEARPIATTCIKCAA
ncbi:TraR/DksA family transcriptional regulator [Erythrobacter donghaensis]|uniref:TraR/DksA family transcriptional regulator n=1 Tax=Erythrobacter donghaensis TaxID=267135 RepID=UPI000A379B26|nr:TraR/DksA family transcriptional regulator [Erythrobacter donghaensis]